MSKSIVTDYSEICFFCGRQAEGEHHLIFGTAGRELSEKDGLKVPVCNNCHNMGEPLKRVHDNPMAEKLSKMLGQAIYEAKIGTREQFRFEGLEITLNGIMAEIFREGIFRMSEAVKETRKRLEDEEDAGTLTEAGYEQLGAIRQHDLNPQSDFTYYVNCLDTHLHCDSSKKKVYEEMFEQEMQDLSDYTGFNIEG